MNRYYSNSLGRFLSPDPYSGSMNRKNPQSFNRYSYVQNDPVNGSDPTGLDGSGYGGGSDFSFGCYTTELTGMPGEYQICPDMTGGMLGTGIGTGQGWLMFMSYMLWQQTYSTLFNAAQYLATSEDYWSIPTCESAIEGIENTNGQSPSFTQISAAAAEVQFNDASNPQTMIPNYPFNGAQTPALWYFESNPGTYAVASLNSNQQYWWPGSTAGQSQSWIDGAVLHELLHNLGYTDSQIAAGVGATLVADENGNYTETDDISQKLSQECFPQ